MPLPEAISTNITRQGDAGAGSYTDRQYGVGEIQQEVAVAAHEKLMQQGSEIVVYSAQKSQN